MSSLIRRIERTRVESQRIHPVLHPETGKPTGRLYANPPKRFFYQGRGSKLGYTDPQGEELLARLKREEKRS